MTGGIDMEHIDVEQIMKEIRAEIVEKGYMEETLKFQDIPVPKMQGKDYGEFDYGELCYEYSQYNANWNNPMCFPFPPSNPIKIIIQKIIRKISKCVFWPIVNYQNIFNSNIVRFQNQVKYYIEDDMKRREEYAIEIRQMQGGIQQMQGGIQQMQRGIRQMQEEIQQILQEKSQLHEELFRLQEEKCRISEILLQMQEEKRQICKELLQIQSVSQQIQEKLEEKSEENERRIGTVSRQLMDVKWKQVDSLCEIKENEDDILTCKICGYQAKRKSFEKKISECIFNGGKLERYVCPECGVIFGPTKFSDMSQNEIDEDYQVHYYGFHESCCLEHEVEAFYMLKPDKNGIYLNYGCGCWSKSIQKLRADGYNVYGYEPYAPETDNPYMITSKEEISKMRFNGIYSNDLLEHLIDPVEDLCFMKTLLMNPDAKMSHSTTCYAYNHEYTRFHTHFFTGKSLDVLCDRTALKILDSRDALETQDFICYVYGMKENYTNYEEAMWISDSKEEAERRDNTILLHKKGIMCGPYIKQGKGTYKIGIEIELSPNVEKIMLSLTADKGKKRLGEFELINGYNTFSYTLEQMEENVEYVVRNDYDEDVVIRDIKMY